MRLLHNPFVRFISISAALGIFTILGTPRQATTNAISTQISASPTTIVPTSAVTATKTLSPVSTTTAIVTKLEDTDDGHCDPNDCSLREAVSSLTSGGAITFANSVEGIIDLDNMIRITNAIEIEGKLPKSDVITLRAKNSHLLFKVEASASLTLNLLTLVGSNEVLVSGGILVDHAQLTVIDSTFRDNSRSAIINSRGITRINGSVFYRNSASGGGAISNVFGTAYVTNTTFFENKATVGGAISNAGGVINISYSTIANNVGNGSDNISNRGQFNIDNSIILGRVRKHGSFTSCSGTSLTDKGHNIQYPYDHCSATISVLDPLLSLVLADNGGPTWTLALMDSSPALDTGEATSCASIGWRDQRGFPRSSDNCDIGAYEQQ